MNLMPALTALETTALVRRLDDADLAYLIKHTMVQETVYGGLLKNERRRLHQLIGQALEEVYPDARSDNAARLAQHFAAAGDDAKIALYAAWAGDDAARTFATAEAIRQYSAALDAALRLKASSKEIIELATKLGRMYELVSDNQSALATYARLSDLATQRNDPSCELAALMLQATLRATPTSVFDPEQGQQILDRALELARALEDGAAQAQVLWNLLLLNGFTGNHRAAITYGEQSLTLARALGLEHQIAYTLNDIGNYGYFAGGEPLQARAALAQARTLWRKLDILPMLSDNLNNSGLIEYLWGNYQGARAFCEEALHVSERTENAWGIALAHTLHGCLAYEAGDFGKALNELQLAYDMTRDKILGISIIASTNLALLYASLGEIDRGREVIQIAVGEIGIVLYRAPSKAALAYLTFLSGDTERARTFIHQARPRTPEELEFSYLPNILAQGEYYLSRDEPDECIASMSNILDKLHSHGLATFSADAELYLARGLAMRGEVDTARAMYERAAKSATDIGSQRALLPIYTHWAQFEQAQNQPERAQGLAHKAKSLRDQIAAGLPLPDRESFLKFNDPPQV